MYVCSFHTILYLRLFIPYDFVFTFVYSVYKSIGNQHAAELGHPHLNFFNDFNDHGSVHRESMSIIVQKDATM